MENKLIELYCTICQCNDSRFREELQRQSNNNCPQFTDEELITVYLWGKGQQLLTRKAIYNYTKSHLFEWFPALPSYQAFCRRLNRIAEHFGLYRKFGWRQFKLAARIPIVMQWIPAQLCWQDVPTALGPRSENRCATSATMPHAKSGIMELSSTPL